MLPLTHSPFLQALGYAIINSLWQFALLWLIYVLINATLRLSSHQKYTGGLLMQFAGFIWFIATFILYFRQHLQVTEIFSLHKASLLSITHNEAVTIREKYLAFVLQIEKLFPYLSAAYLVILIFSGIKWIKAYNLTIILNTKGLHKIDVNWRLFVKQLSFQLGIKREVKIYLSEMAKIPLTIGFFKPLILIPLASLNNLNTQQMEAVILHELAHIKRFDYLFNLLLALVESVLFFNPFMLLISRHIKRERENCCDDWVLQYNYSASSYAHALLQIATCQSSGYFFALKAADNKKALLQRIRRMIEKKEIVFFNYRHQLVALLVVISVLGSLSILSSVRKPNDAEASRAHNKGSLQKISAKSDEPAFYPVSTFVSPNLKSGLNIKPTLEKISKKNLQTNTTCVETENKKIKTDGQSNTLRMPVEVNTTSLSDMYEQVAEDVKKDMEMHGIKAVEDFSAGVTDREKQIAVAEEKFQIAVDLFKKNQVLFNQNQFKAEMKAAFEQIKAARMQLQLAQQNALPHEADEDMSSENKIVDFLLPVISNKEKMNSLTARLQLKIQEAQKQCDKLSENNAVFYNADLNNMATLSNFSFSNNARSFSFTFTEKPKKVASQSTMQADKKIKRNKILIQQNSDSILKNIIPPPPEVIQIPKKIYTIKI